MYGDCETTEPIKNGTPIGGMAISVASLLFVEDCGDGMMLSFWGDPSLVRGAPLRYFRHRASTPSFSGQTPIITCMQVDARRPSGRRVATLAPRPSRLHGALAPPSPQRSPPPPPSQMELQVCVCVPQPAPGSATRLDT